MESESESGSSFVSPLLLPGIIEIFGVLKNDQMNLGNLKHIIYIYFTSFE